MIHLRPQRVYKPTTSSGNPNNSIANYLDRYYNQGLYRLRLETPRGTSLTEDNSQITCYAHVFNNTDGSEVTDRLKGRGFRPTWLLDDKPIDSTCISEEGYLLTLDSAHLTDYTQTVTLQALDTEILSALSDEPQFDIWLQQTLKGQGIQPTLLKQSETLINFALVNKARNESINKLLEDLTAHPLTVSKDGHWRIWDALKKTYITTEYLSRGPKGDKGDKPKLSLDDKLRLLADGELVSMVSLKGPKGDPGDRGAKGDKGDKPKLSLDDKLRLLADGELVSMASLKGPKGDKGEKGDKGDKPNLSLDDKLRLLADGELVSMVSLKGPKGDPGDRGAKGDKGEPGQKGDKGDKPNLSLDDKLRLLADGELVSMVSLKGPKGDPGDRGAKGDKGEDAGRYLGRARRIHPDLIGNYLQETDTGNNWLTAKEGDYVYLVGDAPNRGGDKETYYVVREHKSKTEWEVYNIKGHTPRLTLDEKFHLLADGEMVSDISLKGEAGHNPNPEDVLNSQKFQDLVTTPFYNDLSITNKYLENAFAHINNIFTTMASDRTYTITSSGYVSSRVAQTCPNISKDYAPKHVDCNIPRAEPQIRLVTYSAYESLKSQVEMLTSKLAQLEARTSVTPITNTDLRQDFDDAYSFRISLYPKYGDWLLTSDSKEQNISFAGLKAEVGRSIYIQTRKRAYLYANGHSFYGLPGSSTSENQWLSNNTTYRFVRASSTSWCVTSSSSPYPWT